MRWLRTLIACAVVLGGGATSDGAPGERGPSTMSAGPGQPAQIDERPRPAIGQEVRRSSDHNAAYLGAAIVVLGVMTWWNRRRRERFEREDRDADELRAAARGDARPEAGEADRARETR
jgi:hypothetical protein